jgi:hypothetical protein
MPTSAEQTRLNQCNAGEGDWRRWGPFLSDRAWGTVREDYSANGDAWNYFPHDHARSRVYRWNEDGLGGFCDEKLRSSRSGCSASAIRRGTMART